MNIMSVVLKSCLSLVILTSCESHEQKSNDAFNRFKEEKMMIKDTVLITKEIIQGTKKIASVKKKESQNEWVKFNNSMEIKILKNETKIKELKENSKTTSKSIRKITRIEQDNNDLKHQMAAYNEEVKINLEKFKLKINQHVNEIDLELQKYHNKL